MRSIRKIHKAHYSPIHDLVTWSPLPSATIDQVDPFLFLNHHGPQKYTPGNHGLPFGPHPHRGMETVTFILEGDILHQDSGGHESVIEAGGVQWMTAGSGLIHAEVSSPAFKKNGGDLEILQLWINLPAKLKMVTPSYKGLNRDQIPTVSLDNGKVNAVVISGTLSGTTGAFESLSGVTMTTLYLKDKAKLSLSVPADHSIFFYIVRGQLMVNATQVNALQLVEFNYEDEALHLSASSDSVVLFGHAKPFNEPVVARGPFVMNTEEEIRQAYEDYRMGKFGAWSH